VAMNEEVESFMAEVRLSGDSCRQIVCKLRHRQSEEEMLWGKFTTWRSGEPDAWSTTFQTCHAMPHQAPSPLVRAAEFESSHFSPV